MTAESPGRDRPRWKKSSRRIKLGLAILLALAAVPLWGVGIEPGLLVERHRTIASDKWPSRVPPLRIAIVSDLHVGAPHIDLARVDDIVARINAGNPDLVLLLGDFVIHGVLLGDFVPPGAFAPRLAKLRAKHGVYAVLGNHDWWYDGEEVRRALEQAGIGVLENEAVAILRGNSRVWIAGIADDVTRVPDPVGTVAGIAAGDPVIVAAHNPAVFLDTPGRVAVTLAGHSHGGQIFVPWLGAIVTPGRAPLRYDYGHIREFGRDLLITSGIGTSILPVRINMPPEIVFLTIGSADSMPPQGG